MKMFSSLPKKLFLQKKVGRRLLIILFAFFIFKVGFCQTVCGPGQFIQTFSTITVDGLTNEPVWATAPFNYITHPTAQGTKPGPSAVSNFSARWRSVWNKSGGMYFFVEVNDPIMNFDPNVEQYYFDYDAVEMFISATDDTLQSYQPTDVHYGISDTSNHNGVWRETINSGANTNTTGITYAFQTVTNQPFGSGGAGYDVEIYVPWSAIGSVSEPFTSRIGFDMAIDDNNSNPNAAIVNAGDGYGLLGGIYRDEQFTWYNTTNDDYKDPHSFDIVSVTGPPSAGHAGRDTAICFGSTLALGGNIPQIGTGSWTFSSNSPSTKTSQLNNIHGAGAIFTPSLPGTYQLIWTIGNSPCITTSIPDTVKIIVNSVNASVNAPSAICYGMDTSVVFNGTPNAIVTYMVNNGADQTVSLDGSGADTLRTGILTDTTIYTLVSVTGTTIPSCSQVIDSSATINVNPIPTAAASAPSTICSGADTTVVFNGTPNTIVTYNVNNGPGQTISLDRLGAGTLRTNNLTNATTYELASIAYAGTPGCSQPLSSSKIINISPLPTASISGPSTICAGVDTTITFNGTQNAQINYTANGTNETTTLDNTGVSNVSTGVLSTTTTYSLVSVTGTGTPSCTQSLDTSAIIAVTQLPVVSISPSDTTIQLGDNITLRGEPDSTSWSYSWIDSATALVISSNPTAQVSPTVDDSYTLTAITNLLGCKSVPSNPARVHIVSSGCLIPKNAFTPNNSGPNNTWLVSGCVGSVPVSVSVYNRWGGLVYHSDNYANTWDGTYRGKPVPDGTYYYVVNAYYSDHTATLTGNVTILR